MKCEILVVLWLLFGFAVAGTLPRHVHLRKRFLLHLQRILAHQQGNFSLWIDHLYQANSPNKSRSFRASTDTFLDLRVYTTKTCCTPPKDQKHPARHHREATTNNKQQSCCKAGINQSIKSKCSLPDQAKPINDIHPFIQLIRPNQKRRRTPHLLKKKTPQSIPLNQKTDRHTSIFAREHQSTHTLSSLRLQASATPLAVVTLLNAPARCIREERP